MSNSMSNSVYIPCFWASNEICLSSFGVAPRVHFLSGNFVASCPYSRREVRRATTNQPFLEVDEYHTLA